MSLESVLSRIAEIQGATHPAPVTQAPPSTKAPTGDPSLPFAAALQGASGSAGNTIAGLAQREVGQREEPMGSNDSARIAQYRTAVPGGGVGPWCAYFASWLAREAGTPLGERGQGFARVDDVWAWGERTGRVVPGGAAATPQPGDLIIWDEHMGVVESVLPDGSIQTIEGNSSDQVSRRTHRPGQPVIGYVRPA